MDPNNIYDNSFPFNKKGNDLMRKRFGLIHKGDVKIQNDRNLTALNTGSFFPYRKSFICYWLLPFVGFVSLGTLSLGKQSMKETSIYTSDTLNFSKAKVNESKKNILNEKL